MKLAYVCNEYPPAPQGGIGTFVFAMAHAMKRAGHRVTVVGFGPVGSERDDNGVRVVTLKQGSIRRLSWIIDRLRLHRWLRREVSRGNIDLIETPEYAGMMPLPFTACPVVVRLHLAGTAIAREAGRQPQLGEYISEYLTLFMHRRWIAVSDHALRLAVATFGLKPVESTTIYNPIEIEGADDAATLDVPAQFVLFAGYVCARKGAYAVAEAARLLLAWRPDLHVVFMGELAVERGVRADRRIREIVGPEFDDRIHFSGRVKRATVLAAMRRARALVFPSRLENMPVVTGEAMLSGLPVITSTCDPFPEFLTHEQTGLLVPPDDPAALSAAIARVLDGPAFAARMSEAARQLAAERFSMEECLDASERFYRGECIPRRTVPSAQPPVVSSPRK